MSSGSVWRHSSGYAWSADDLVTAVRRKGRLPATSADITAAVICAEATDALWGVLAPILLTQADGRNLRRMFIPMAESHSGYGMIGASSESDIRSDPQMKGEFFLPSDAMAGNVVSISYYKDFADRAGRDLLPVSAAQRDQYMSDSDGEPRYYIIRDKTVEVLPAPAYSTTACLVVEYVASYPEIVPTSECGLISAGGVSADSDDDGTFAVTMTLSAAHPTSWPSTQYRADIVPMSLGAPYWANILITSDTGNSNKDLAATVSNSAFVATTPVSASSLNAKYGRNNFAIRAWAGRALQSNVVTGGALGDFYVCQAGQSCAVPIPREFRQPLYLQTAAQILRSIGDTNGANEMIGDVQRMLGGLQNMITPRSKGRPPKLISRGVLRSRQSGRRGPWWD